MSGTKLRELGQHSQMVAFEGDLREETIFCRLCIGRRKLIESSTAQ